MVVVVANRAVEMREEAGHSFVGLLSNTYRSVANFMHRRKVQKRLEALDDRLLEDIGLDRSQISTYVWGR